jgi:hypothetical protein
MLDQYFCRQKMVDRFQLSQQSMFEVGCMNCFKSLGFVCLLSGTMLAAAVPDVQKAKEPGLLFYLSGDQGFNADYAAGGNPVPNYLSDVKILPGGAKGSYLQCGANQLLSYWAPGNIYAQRGTLAFDWRPREAVDQTEFPIFRVGYADHSSWDMVWLRIDYNGHGFDAFVTDVNLGRTRVSYSMAVLPKPDEWLHFALAWDETSGIRFYVNGKLVGQAAATGRFDTGLDQFGPHSRIISPQGVETWTSCASTTACSPTTILPRLRVMKCRSRFRHLLAVWLRRLHRRQRRLLLFQPRAGSRSGGIGMDGTGRTTFLCCCRLRTPRFAR